MGPHIGWSEELDGGTVTFHGGGPPVTEHRRLWLAVRDIEKAQGKRWPDPTPEMLKDPMFNAIWEVMMTWDIAVDNEYEGYMAATGNHVRAVYDAIKKVKDEEA